MKKQIFITLILFLSSSLQAENIDDIFNNVKKYVAEKRYGKALTELNWAQRELENLKLTAVKDSLPVEITEFKGMEFLKDDATSMLGMSMVKREYKSSDKSFKLELTLKTSQESFMGGLLDLGKMAASQAGAAGGAGVFRVKGRTAMFENNTSKNPDLTIFLDSGAMIKLNTNSAVDLKLIAEALDLDKIEASIKD